MVTVKVNCCCQGDGCEGVELEAVSRSEWREEINAKLAAMLVGRRITALTFDDGDSEELMLCVEAGDEHEVWLCLSHDLLEAGLYSVAQNGDCTARGEPLLSADPDWCPYGGEEEGEDADRE